jgi:hypothetical protein
MPIESLDLQVHETRMIEISGRLKPSQGIRGHGKLTLSSDFKQIEVLGPLTNLWRLDTVSFAEFDEMENVLYLEFLKLEEK